MKLTKYGAIALIVYALTLMLLLVTMTNTKNHNDSPPMQDAPNRAVTPFEFNLTEGVIATPSPTPTAILDPIPQPAPEPRTSEWRDFEATFYSLNGGDGSGHTYTGTIPKVGQTLAVDRHVIKLGSKVEIRYPDGTVETRIAEDIGGAIKGHILDVYVLTDKEANRRGRQHVKLRIVYDK